MSVEAADFMDDICRPKSRDAKFCVSRGNICCYCQWFIEWVYWRGLLVRRKILRLYWGYMLLLPADYWMGVLVWVARETQDFASLLGGRRWFDVVKWGAWGALVAA